MASDAVGKFVEAINKSPDLLAKCKGVMKDSKDATGFAALGKANGFQFTADDAQGYFKEVLGTSKPGGLTELDEKSLAKAAGGKSASPTKNPRELQLGQSVRLFNGLGLSAPSWSFFK